MPYNFKPQFTADFFNEINSMGLKQINYVENHAKNVLDLIIVNDEIEYELRECLNPIVKVDAPHPSIECVIHNIIPKKTTAKKRDMSETIYDFKRTDFLAMNNYFKSINLSSIIQNMDVNRAFECFYSTLDCACPQFVPKIKIHQKNSRPWYNADLKKLRNLRNREFGKKKSNLDNEHEEYAKKFDDLNAILYEQYNSDVSRNIKRDPKKFWSFVREQKTSKGYELIMRYKDKMGSNDNEIANLFAEFFSSVFCSEKNDSEIYKILNELNDQCQTDINVEEVFEAMKKFPLNKGIGVDNFPPTIIRNCRYALAKPITDSFRQGRARNFD